MRKVLSLVLVLALVLGSFSMAFAATPTDVVGTPSAEAVTVLSDLGVVSGYPDGTFKPEGIVTRAEMAKLIVAALGLTDYATGTTSKFPDMAGATWAQGFVSYATGLGVIIGYPDGTFKPSQTVSYTEAAAMIVRALGYTDKSLLPATWPANYVVKAKAIGILDGITSTIGGANRGDIAMMLYNALDEKIGTVDADNKWTAADPTDTMLDRLGAEVTEGVIIYGTEDTKINLRAYIGAEGTTYTVDDEIVAFTVDSDFLIGEFNKTAKTFTSDDVDYSVTTSLSAMSVPFFLNGVQKSVSTNHPVLNLDGVTSPTLLGRDLTVKVYGDFTASRVTEIDSISTWIVDGFGQITASDLEDITEEQSLFDSEFILDDEDNVDPFAYELVGVDSLSDIELDNVVYVYGSDIRKVAVGTEVVEGEITRVQGDDYTINGEEYSAVDTGLTGNAEFKDFPELDITGKAGDTVTAYLDAYGNIFQMGTEAAEENFAVVLETGNGSGAGLTAVDPAIKLFLADGTDKTFTVDADDLDAAEKAFLFTDATLNNWLLANVTAGTIVTYTVNEDGAIDDLDANLTSVATTNQTSNLTARGYYDGFAVDTNAVLFTFDGDKTPANLADEDNYGVTDLDEVLDTDLVNSDYVLNEETSKIDAMLLYDFNTTDEVYGVVTDFATTNTDAGYELTMLVDGEEVVYVSKVDASVAGFDFTKLYEISFNLAGEVTALTPEPAVAPHVTLITTPSAITIDGFVVTNSATDPDATYTLDSAVVVYEWDGDVFVTDNKRDINGAENVQLFDLVDADGVYDTVLIFPDWPLL